MIPIRQNATHKVVIGPVVAVGDAFTPVTTLDLATADEAEAILHDNGTVVDISAYTFAAIADADGYYHLTLQAGISGTVGHMTVVANDDDLCLPVRATFVVVEEAVYDRDYAAAATGDTDATTAILADTNEVQADLTDGGRLDLIIDATLADTNELQADWVDGGRLDLILDSAAGATVAGVGAVTCNIYTKSGLAVALDGVEVWITSDAAGTVVVAGTLCSDAIGLTTFYLDVGVYYLWRQLSGYTFTNPQTLTVA